MMKKKLSEVVRGLVPLVLFLCLLSCNSRKGNNDGAEQDTDSVTMVSENTDRESIDSTQSRVNKIDADKIDISSSDIIKSPPELLDSILNRNRVVMLTEDDYTEVLGYQTGKGIQYHYTSRSIVFVDNLVDTLKENYSLTVDRKLIIKLLKENGVPEEDILDLTYLKIGFEKESGDTIVLWGGMYVPDTDVGYSFDLKLINGKCTAIVYEPFNFDGDECD